MLDLKKLNEKITESLEAIEPARDKKMFLVVGATGAGKSTTINYLKRYPMMINEEKGNIIPRNSSIKEPAPTGDSISAVTSYPAVYSTDKGYMCDCPGFEDNRGPESRIAISICTEAAVKNSKKIDGLVVVIEDATIRSVRGKGLQDVAHTIGSLFGKSGFDPSASIMFVITKGDPRFCTRKNIVSKVNDIIKFNEGKIRSLTDQYKSIDVDSGMYIGSSKDSSEESMRKQIINTKLTLEVFKMMKKKQKNIIPYDVLDDGTGRKNIFEAMQNLKQIPKKAFDFSESDSVRENFVKLVSKQLVDYRKKLLDYQAMPNTIKLKTTEMSNAKTKFAKTKKQKVVLNESGGKSLGKNDPAYKANKKTIAANKDRLVEIQKMIKNNQGVLSSKNKALASLDLSDNVKYWKDNFKKSRVDSVTRAVDDMGTGIFDVTVGQDSGVVRGFLGTAIGSVVVLAFSPFAAIYGAGKRFSHTFEYSGPSYTKIIAKHPNDKTFIVLENNKKAGRYKAEYESERGKSSQASVEIYIEKRNVPENAARISELTSEIENVMQETDSLRDEFRDLNSANKELREINDELRIAGKINLEKQNIRLDNLIKIEKKRVATCIKELESHKATHKKLQTALLAKRPFFNMVLKLSASGVVSFKLNGYPKLTEDFRKLYLNFAKLHGNIKIPDTTPKIISSDRKEGEELQQHDVKSKKILYIKNFESKKEIKVYNNSIDKLEKGFTKLMQAVMRKEQAQIEALLKQGARVDIKGRNGATALSLAQQLGDVDIIFALMSYMPKKNQQIDFY